MTRRPADAYSHSNNTTASCLFIDCQNKAMARRCVQAILAYSLHNLFQCATVDAALLQVKRG